MEGSLGEAAVELLQGHEPGRGDVAPAGQGPHASGDLVEAGDVVGGQRNALLGLAVLAHGVALVLGGELAAHRPPHLVLLLGVVDPRRRLAGMPAQGGRGDLVAAASVLGIVGARVIVGEMNGHCAGIVGGDRRVELSLFVHLVPGVQQFVPNTASPLSKSRQIDQIGVIFP